MQQWLTLCFSPPSIELLQLQCYPQPHSNTECDLLKWKSLLWLTKELFVFYARKHIQSELPWNFSCRWGKIPSHPPGSVMLGTFLWLPDICSIWHGLSWDTSVSCKVRLVLEGQGWRGNRLLFQVACRVVSSLKAGFPLKVDKRDLLY